MVDEPDNAVLRMLRDMRARLDQLDARLERMESRLDDLFEVSTYSLGLASSSHIRLDVMNAEVEELRGRVTRLEERQ